MPSPSVAEATGGLFCWLLPRMAGAHNDVRRLMEKSPELDSPAPPAAPTFARRSIIRFVTIFAVCVAAYYALSGAALFRESLFPAYLRLNARITAACLRGLGQSVKADDTCVFSPRFFLTVERGCDA